VQHLVIETQIVEADHEVRAQQFVDEFIHFLFRINPVLPARRAVSHPHAHPHVTDFAPAPDFIGGLLCFEIEVNDVFHFRLRVRHADSTGNRTGQVKLLCTDNHFGFSRRVR